MIMSGHHGLMGPTKGRWGTGDYRTENGLLCYDVYHR